MAQYDINLREYWRILRKRKFIVFFVGIALCMFSTAFAFFKAPTPIYVSVCSIKFEKETTVEGLYAKTITWSGGDDIETQISVIKSFTIFEKVAQRLGLVPKTPLHANSSAKNSVVRIIDDLQSKVEISRQGMTTILNIKVKDTDPAFAQKLANTVAAVYRDLHSEMQLKRSTEAIKYIDEQLVQVRKKLREAEEEFNQFTQNHQLLSIDIQSEKLLARSQEVQNEIRKLTESQGELQNLLARLDKFIANPSAQANFYSARATPQYHSANDSLTELQLRRETLLKDFTPLHPEVVDVGSKILEGARKMRLLLLSHIGDLEKQEQDKKSELQELERKSSALMEKKLEHDRLKRKVELYNDMTTLLERKNQEALIKKAEKPEEVTIVKPALFPVEPINPPRTAATGAMGLVIGLVLGMIAAFIVETFDTSLGAIEDVEETLKTHVLGVIPQADAKEVSEDFKQRLPKGVAEIPPAQMVNLVVHYAPKSMMAESFRGLRTNLQFNDAASGTKAIAVTSAAPQEGKTIVSVNLAITMAQAGVRTLLIGADMRKPMFARAFGVEQTPGLSEILLGNCPWRDAVQTVTDLLVGRMCLDEVLMTPGLDNLHLIPAGSIPPNPAELVESKRLKEFIEEARSEYDIILLDAPPILSTADAAILSSKMDGVLLVYRVGSVSRGLLKRATAQLEQVNCRLLGVILNGMKPEVSPDFQNFKYYKYYFPGEEGRQTGEVEKGLPLFGENAMSYWGRKKKTWERGRSLVKGSVGGLTLLLVAAGLLWHFGILDSLQEWDSSKPAQDKDVPPVAQKVPPQALPKPAPAPALPVQAKKESARTQTPRSPAVTVKPESVAEVKVHASEDKPRPVVPLPVRSAGPALEKKALPEKKPPEIAPVLEGEYPYSIYLGSLKTLEQAKRAISVYAGRGIEAYWVKVQFKEKGDWYRIYAGHFKDQEEAEGFARDRRIVEKETLKTAYANLLGVYSHPKDLGERVKTVSELGYSSYVIKGSDGKWRLLVGAYVTEEAAEQQRRELTARGIENRVIKR